MAESKKIFRWDEGRRKRFVIVKERRLGRRNSGEICCCKEEEFGEGGIQGKGERKQRGGEWEWKENKL